MTIQNIAKSAIDATKVLVAFDLMVIGSTTAVIAKKCPPIAKLGNKITYTATDMLYDTVMDDN